MEYHTFSGYTYCLSRLILCHSWRMNQSRKAVAAIFQFVTIYHCYHSTCTCYYVHFYIILCRYCGYCQAGKLHTCYHIHFSRSQLLWLTASTRKTWAILHHVLRLSKLFLGTSFTSELWRELGKIWNPASQSVTFSRMVNYSWRANI